MVAPVFIAQASDVTYVDGDVTSYTISWTVTHAGPAVPTYSIFKDGIEVVKNTAWSSGVPTTPLEVGSQSEDLHEYIIQLQESTTGDSVADSAQVSILPTLQDPDASFGASQAFKALVTNNFLTANVSELGANLLVRTIGENKAYNNGFPAEMEIVIVRESLAAIQNFGAIRHEPYILFVEIVHRSSQSPKTDRQLKDAIRELWRIMNNHNNTAQADYIYNLRYDWDDNFVDGVVELVVDATKKYVRN